MVKMLNPEQVSELLQVKLSTIYQWTHQEYIPHYKVGRFVRFNELEILRWLSRNERKGDARLRVAV